MHRTKVVFIQRQFSHYRKPVFDKLSDEYEFYLLHGGVESTIEEGKAGYAIKIDFFKYGRKPTNVFLFVFKRLIKIKAKILVHEANPSILSLPFTFVLCKIMKTKFVLWGHGYNRSKGFYLNLKLRIRLLFMKMADAVVFYDYRTKEIISNYIDEKKLFVALNTINTYEFISLKNQYDKIGKDKIKSKLGFLAKYNMLFIGRLIPEKKTIEAIKTFIEIKEKMCQASINIHIIGDGPLKKDVESFVIKNNLEQFVRIHGAIYDEKELSKILYISDLVINPGYVGLNVNHAYCFNIPIFTFNQGKYGPFHSPEIEYVKNFETGFFAEPYNYSQLADLIIKYLSDKELQETIYYNIEHLIKNKITIDNMLDGFRECFDYLKPKPIK